MAPSSSEVEVRKREVDNDSSAPVVAKKPYKMEIVWGNVALFAVLHAAMLYGFTYQKKTISLVVGWTIGFMQGFGTTIGAHRYFTHKTFKANKPMKILLLAWQTMAGQQPVIVWARDHRMHHKYTDTDADPYNSRRGFFFSHIGWLMVKKHPDVIEKGKTIYMDDLLNDPLIQFQRKYFIPLTILMAYVIPLWISVWICDEPLVGTLFGHLQRYCIGLHLTWTINSIAHLWGWRPFDKGISPTEGYTMGFFTLGEGWHNYHHIFPWDYKASEMPGGIYNLSALIVDFFALLGWVTDRKTVPDHIIKARALRTGDGTHHYSIEAAEKKKLEERMNNNNNVVKGGLPEDLDLPASEHFWGFGDQDMSSHDMKFVHVIDGKKVE